MNGSRQIPSGPDIPESLAPLAARARPARIMTFDVDGCWPPLEADDHYREVWVVLCRRGAPRRLIMLDLDKGADASQRRLEEVAASLDPEEPEGLAMADEELPRVSVVVPSIVSRVEELGRCLDAIGRLDYPNYEVILVDNRRTLPEEDPLAVLAAARPWLRIVREPRPGISAARNAGVAVASGEVVAFTDDDVQIDSAWLRALGARFARDPGLDALTGLILPAELETPSQVWFERYFGGFGSERSFAPVTLEPATNSGPLRGSRVLVRDADGTELRRFSLYGVGAYGAGANMAYRKTTLTRIGGFDEALGVGTPAPGGEDLVAMIDVLWNGGRIGYEPAAFVYHQHRRTYAELLRQIDGYGVGFTAMLVALVRKDRRHLLSVASQLPVALRWKAVQGYAKVRGRTMASGHGVSAGQYPSELIRRELLAFLRGPAAYLRSLRKCRALSAHSSETTS